MEPTNISSIKKLSSFIEEYPREDLHQQLSLLE
jgi:hypothetical protein